VPDSRESQQQAGRDIYNAPATVYNGPYYGSGTSPVEPVAEKIETTVFFVGASPYDISLERLRADREFRRIQDATASNRLRVVNRIAATIDDLADLLDERPEILHVSCHSSDGNLLFEDPDGEPHPIAVTHLAERLREYDRRGGFRLRGIVLSVCDSADFAEEFDGVADTVVAWRGDLDDDCAIAFSKALYRLLGRDPAPTLANAARLAAVEARDSDTHCRTIIDQLIVLPA
jgi:hypothetical protein